jgi:hypothetical protein
VLDFVEQQIGVDVEGLLERNITGALGSSQVGELFDGVSDGLLAVGRRVSKDETLPLVALFVLISFWKLLRLVSADVILCLPAMLADTCISSTIVSDQYCFFFSFFFLF